MSTPQDVQSSRFSDAPEDEPAPNTWRLFVAVTLPDRVRHALASAPGALPPRTRPLVRWIEDRGLHITLKFLGDVEPERVSELQALLTSAAAQSGKLTVRLSATGCFPHPRNPKILWVGLNGEVSRLVQLQGRVEGAMARLGFEPERRRFVPHITVGRVQRDVKGKSAGDVGYGWRRVTIPESTPQIGVDRLTLFRSHLGPGGAQYERIFEAPLN